MKIVYLVIFYLIYLARGSGRPIREIQELLAQHKNFEKMVGKLKGIEGNKERLFRMSEFG